VRAFAANAKQCIECGHGATTWRCEACDELKAAASFDRDVLDNAAKHGRRRVCFACAAAGFSPVMCKRIHAPSVEEKATSNFQH